MSWYSIDCVFVLPRGETNRQFLHSCLRDCALCLSPYGFAASTIVRKLQQVTMGSFLAPTILILQRNGTEPVNPSLLIFCFTPQQTVNITNKTCFKQKTRTRCVLHPLPAFLAAE